MDFWEGRKVLVTGATGIIGSWLTEALQKKGAKVTAFVKSNDPIGIESIKHLQGKIRMQYGDIVNSSDVGIALKNQETVLHLAAVTQVLQAADNPLDAVNVNFNGTVNILEGIRKGDEAFLVLASTDKVYGEPQQLPITEDHPLLSKSPYDAAKLAADRITYSYGVTYGLKSTIARLCNIYGGKDANRLRIIPGCILDIMRGRTPAIRRDGQDVRDYMHVNDAGDGSMKLAENSEKVRNEAFNFGTGIPTKTIDLARMICRLMMYERGPSILNQEIRGEIDRQYMACEKAQRLLGWHPKITLEEGLRQTIEWYQDNRWWLDVMERVSGNAELMSK